MTAGREQNTFLPGRGDGEALREEESKEKITRSDSVLEENQTSPRHNFHEGSKGKNWWIGGAIRGDGDHVTPSGLGTEPCFGSTKVAWDLEYIDSVHESHGCDDQ